jgi:hypothetical protein
MVETSISVSLHEGIKSKTFAAEVTGDLGEPLDGVEVRFVLDGDATLAEGQKLSLVSRRTDELGRAAVSLTRPEGHHGDVGALLRAECPERAASLQVRFLGMTPEHEKHSL